MPLLWNRKVLLAAIETTYGVDAAPAAAAAVLAMNVQFSPMEGQDVSRELELPTLGAQATIPAELHGRLIFEVELAPSGTAGTAPAWGVLMRGCGCAQTIAAGTSVTYNPVSTGHDSVTLHFYIENTRFVLLGARGTATLSLTAQRPPRIRFEFTGLFTLPSTQTAPTPNLAAWKAPQIASAATTPVFSFNSVSLVLRQLEFAMGNEVVPRFLIGGGAERILITQRSERATATVEAVPLTALDPFVLASGQTVAPLTLTHGTGAGKIATLAIPRAQIQRPESPTNTQGIVEWPLGFVPLPDAGDDQWTLTLT